MDYGMMGGRKKSMTDGEQRGGGRMDDHARYLRIWRVLQAARPFLLRFFRFSCEPIQAEGPILLVCNHASARDPILLALALGKRQAYFVASEHLFRKGLLSRALQWLVGIIPRCKGDSGVETARLCLKHLRAGHSICLFAEGEASWDGKSIPVVPGTGTLARMMDAALVTYRLEGAYLADPRWAKKPRKGPVRGRVAGIYQPAPLKQMTTGQLNALIDRDIGEDAWARQAENPAPYRSRHLAECLERLLYLCPKCKRVGTLKSKGDRFFCACGLETRLTPTGFFPHDAPFPTLAQWDAWQKEQLRRRNFAPQEREILFRDEGMTLSRIEDAHRQVCLGSGSILQYADHLEAVGKILYPDAVQAMAMTRHNVLLFSVGEAYYEVRCQNGANLRKYLDWWTAKKTGGR